MCACLCVCQTLDTSSTQHRHTLANRCWSPRAPRRPHYIMRRSAHDCRYFDSTLPPLFLSAHRLCLYPSLPPTLSSHLAHTNDRSSERRCKRDWSTAPSTALPQHAQPDTTATPPCPRARSNRTTHTQRSNRTTHTQRTNTHAHMHTRIVASHIQHPSV